MANSFLTEQVITYLGNKRKIISNIDLVLSDLFAEPNLNKMKFLDAFSGSGVVARYARQKGFEVWANDIEIYTRPINTAFLAINKNEVDSLFQQTALALGVESKEGFFYFDVLAYLNDLVAPVGDEYFAKHYAPKDTKAPDFFNERLFYTRENGLKIDAWLELFMIKKCSPKVRDILLASVLYNMSKHINTSGIMKGFHRGWGGRGGHALGRILAEMKLEPIPFIEAPIGHVMQSDASELDNSIYYDVIYADPPYNQHQYGANYHLLTTATLNDKYDPGPVVKGARAGIRVDHQRSAFCKKKGFSAEQAFEAFVHSANGRYLIVSYNNEGIISPKKMLSILHDQGRNRVTIKSFAHDKFKGGKNTQNSTKTLEYLFVTELGVGQKEEEYKDVIEELCRLTQELEYKEAYIDIPKISSVSGIEIESTDKGWNILFNQHEICGVRHNYKIIDFYEGFSSIDMHKYVMTKLDRMELYLKQKQWKYALQLLGSFKIKKYESDFKRFGDILLNSSLSNKERIKLEKTLDLLRV